MTDSMHFCECTVWPVCYMSQILCTFTRVRFGLDVICVRFHAFLQGYGLAWMLYIYIYVHTYIYIYICMCRFHAFSIDRMPATIPRTMNVKAKQTSNC